MGLIRGGSLENAPGTNLRVTLTQSELATTKANAVRMGPGTMVHESGNFHVVGTSPFETTGTQQAWDALADTTPVTVVTLNVTAQEPGGAVLQFNHLGLHAANPNYAGLVLGPNPPRTLDRLTNPVPLSNSHLQVIDRTRRKIFTKRAVKDRIAAHPERIDDLRRYQKQRLRPSAMNLRMRMRIAFQSKRRRIGLSDRPLRNAAARNAYLHDGARHYCSRSPPGG